MKLVTLPLIDYYEIMSAHPLIVFFKEIDKDDINLVGGKTANLGEMVKAGFPVPNGFAITVHAYDLFLKENNLEKYIREILKTVDPNDPNQLTQASRNINKKILSGKIPDEVSREIIKGYRQLRKPFKTNLLAVRSSATAEDLPSASFAGQQETFLNIQGEANLLESVRKCLASLFTARAIFYREENKISHLKVKISVIVQKMIQSQVSGVLFTIDPVTNEKDRIVIEAIWGLGELIVQGLVIPDKYIIQKDTFYILSKEVSEQSIQLVRRKGKTKKVKVPQRKRNGQKLSDQEIVKLAKLGQQLQKHYYFPQDAEWAKDNKNIFLVQTRPVTTIGKTVKEKASKLALTPILSGSPASPGIATGYVKIVKSTREINQVKKGDVLVATMTSPDFVPAMKKAVAIITDQGGQTSHAAIVSREMGLACVVGTKEATKKLKNGFVVTVDGSSGQVFLGGKIKLKVSHKAKEKIVRTKTATKLYVNLAEPDRAQEIAKLNVDGIGLLRAEFMIADIGIHPKEAIKLKKHKEFIKKLTDRLTRFCQAFSPRPIVYRATDFKTNEYRQLKGGKAWEPLEPNPLLGFRGAFRYLAQPDVFNLELSAIKKVRQKYKNLYLMIPFVRSPQELADVRKLVAAEGLFQSPSFKFWMMVELPVNVILLKDFIKVGLDGVSIGSNDLSMLILGTDRDNAEVAKAFNERSAAVYWALERVIKLCNKHKVSSSICGQAPSEYDDLVEHLVKIGISSISVNLDAINRVRGVIAETEKKLIK